MSLFANKFNQLDEMEGVLPDEQIGGGGYAVDYSAMSRTEAAKHLFSQVDWQEYIQAGSFLSNTEKQLLERAQENLDFAMETKTSTKGLAAVLLKVADKCTGSIPVQQYVFTKILEILEACDGTDLKSRAVCFTVDEKQIQDVSFLRSIRSNDSYIQRTASEGLALLLTVYEGDMNSLLSWICDNLSSSVNNVPEVAIPALVVLMRAQSSRKPFANRGGIEITVSLLERLGSNGPAQQLYDLSFVLWAMSMEEDTDYNVYRTTGAIKILTDLLAAAPSRKVVRMAAACLSNLARSENDDILTEMLTGGLVKLLENMIHANAHKQAGDPEVEADVRCLFEVLMKNYREYSSFDRWVVEVTTSGLKWGIVHTEKFWRENAKLLEADDFKYLKELIAQLSTSESAVSTAVALYDLGEFTRFYPNGRGVVKVLGGKDIAMDMIGSEDPDIQRHALQCISKIMVTNWEFMK